MSIPYAGRPSVGHSITVVNCPGPGDDTVVAAGIVFDSGDGPDVPSRLVGRSTRLECDPYLAEPDLVPRANIRSKRQDQRRFR